MRPTLERAAVENEVCRSLLKSQRSAAVPQAGVRAEAGANHAAMAVGHTGPQNEGRAQSNGPKSWAAGSIAPRSL